MKLLTLIQQWLGLIQQWLGLDLLDYEGDL
jgi:hypothetical protein